jgi:hypothetical protein
MPICRCGCNQSLSWTGARKHLAGSSTPRLVSAAAKNAFDKSGQGTPDQSTHTSSQTHQFSPPNDVGLPINPAKVISKQSEGIASAGPSQDLNNSDFDMTRFAQDTQDIQASDIINNSLHIRSNSTLTSMGNDQNGWIDEDNDKDPEAHNIVEQSGNIDSDSGQSASDNESTPNSDTNDSDLQNNYLSAMDLLGESFERDAIVNSKHLIS